MTRTIGSIFASRLMVARLAALGLGVLAILGAVRAGEGSKAACCRSAARAGETTARYEAPDVELVRADGEAVRLKQELDDGRPVILSFVFTTCTVVCPIASRALAEAQRRLGADAEAVHLVSVSIDPEHDTPARLAGYAARIGARPGWTFLTGTLEATSATQRAFGASWGDKMGHVPVVLLRAAPGEPWTRIEGFVTAEDLVARARAMLGRARRSPGPERRP